MESAYLVHDFSQQPKGIYSQSEAEAQLLNFSKISISGAPLKSSFSTSLSSQKSQTNRKDLFKNTWKYLIS